MHRKSIIDEIADQADDFLEGVTSREQARAAVSEVITLDYRTLSPADRQSVTDGVMAVLEEEGFFDSLRRSSDEADGTVGDPPGEG